MNAEKIVSWPGRTTAGIEHGTVRGGGEEGYVVHGAAGIFVATTAFCCWVKPKVGDRVIYTRDPEGGCYVLSILKRTTSRDAVLTFPGDVMVESASGHVNIVAAQGIALAGGSSVNMRAVELTVSAGKGRLDVGEMQATGESLTGTLDRVRLVSETMDVVAQRVTQRMKRCYRWVEEVEHLTVGQLIHTVRNLFALRTRQCAVTAKEDVKIDGERIHLG